MDVNEDLSFCENKKNGGGFGGGGVGGGGVGWGVSVVVNEESKFL